MEKLINDLTQKDEQKAQKAAQFLIDNKDVKAFNLLCQKSEFLFDFVKNNVRKRLKNAINVDNFRNLTAFFEIYSTDYADLLISSIAKHADEELSDEMYELLENGTMPQKTYAAKYFCYIPDTIAMELLAKYAFGNNIELAANSAQALGAMQDQLSYTKAITNLSSNDDFETMKAVRFLSAYGNSDAVSEMLNVLDTTAMAENIASEIPYLMPFSEMFKTQNFDKVLNCFDFILLGLGEILPLYQIFDFEVYDTLQYLINTTENGQNSHISEVLLRAYEKFSTLTSNEEYTFDEQKDVKEEVNAIKNLLTKYSEAFWQEQEKLIVQELTQSKNREIAALEVIRALEIKQAKEAVIDFIKNNNNEQLILLATSVAKTLGCIKELNCEEICSRVKDETSKAVIRSYFV